MDDESAAAAAAKTHQDNRELCTAALQLATLMYTTPDPETLATLQQMKRNFLSPANPLPPNRRRGGGRAEDFPAAPIKLPSAYPIDDAQIKMLLRDQPPRPPIRGLETLIGQCTPPEVKQLTESDIKDSQARLSLPKPYGRESIKPLLTPDEDVEKGIPVTAYDADGERFEMKLKLWANRKVYVLTSGWKPFAKAHGLRHHEDFVTIWVFRKLDTGNLCVAITSRRLPVYWALKRSRPPAIQ